MSNHGQRGEWQFLCMWDELSLNLEGTAARFPANDTDAALLMLAEFPGELHYATSFKTWYSWDGKHHKRDLRALAEQRIHEFALRYRAAVKFARTALEDRLRRQGTPEAELARTLEREWKERGLAAAAAYSALLMNNPGVLRLRETLSHLCAVEPTVFESCDPWLLNCEDGTWDLRTGSRKPHDPRDWLTHCLPAPDFTGQCPLFLDTVKHLAGYDLAVWDYLLRVLGYALLGHNMERKIVFMVGETGSGKTVVLDVMRAIMGTLATDSSNDLICTTRHGRNARTENSIRGRRLVVVPESTDFRRMDEAQVKKLTGERQISIDKHYATDTIPTDVTWLIVQPTNVMPATAHPEDSAIIDRYVIIPTGKKVPPEKRVKGLAEKIFESEGRAVLGLLMKAATAYAQHGWPPAPVAVEMATESYFGQQDQVAAFLREMTALGENRWVSKPEAWKIYGKWAADDKMLTRNAFHESMARQPGVTVNDGSARYYGIEWNENALAFG